MIRISIRWTCPLLRAYRCKPDRTDNMNANYRTTKHDFVATTTKSNRRPKFKIWKEKKNNNQIPVSRRFLVENQLLDLNMPIFISRKMIFMVLSILLLTKSVAHREAVIREWWLWPFPIVNIYIIFCSLSYAYEWMVLVDSKGGQDILIKSAFANP